MARPRNRGSVVSAISAPIEVKAMARLTPKQKAARRKWTKVTAGANPAMEKDANTTPKRAWYLRRPIRSLMAPKGIRANALVIDWTR